MKGAVGLATGMAFGYGYHFLMKVMGSTCINCRVPAVPIVVCGIIGLCIGLSAKN